MRHGLVPPLGIVIVVESYFNRKKGREEGAYLERNVSIHRKQIVAVAGTVEQDQVSSLYKWECERTARHRNANGNLRQRHQQQQSASSRRCNDKDRDKEHQLQWKS